MQLNPDTDLTKAQEDISEWLLVEGYKELILSWDPGYIYKAAFIETFEIKELLRKLGKLKLNFICHPIKFIKGAEISKSIQNGIKLTNIGNYEARPIIKITGNGDGALIINGRETRLKSVQNSLVIDMQANQVYSGNLSAWDKIIRSPQSQMPYLDKGENAISWTGNFTIEMAPYWGVKI